jgi:geranylgeranyl diphosphate/geranylgeranyl-bacteriochlorophyllide a reductase
MKLVAVLGGGPAGAFAAENLARAGVRTVIFDEKLAWEKPCGGGLTYKAYQRYPFLIENSSPKKIVSRMCIAAPKAGEAKLGLEQPLVIYSRFELNRMLLERAERAGAQLEKTRVLEIRRSGRGWAIRTQNGTLEADYCMVATGARNSLRNVGTEWTRTDTMCALGYYVPLQQDQVDIQFLPNLHGYIWVFPRCGHASVGIGAKGEAAQVLRARLERYMDEKGIPFRGAAFFSHMLPSLDFGRWKTNRVAGEGWLAIGDAGGLVDPITGEGLYYAMRSAEVACQMVLDESRPLAEKAIEYCRVLHHDFCADLEYGASISERLFLGSFLFGTIPARTVAFIRRSPRFRVLVGDLVAGTQSYLGLKERLWSNLRGTLTEVAANRFSQGPVPDNT